MIKKFANDNELVTVVNATDYSFLAWTGIESPINYNSCPLTCNACTMNFAYTLAKSVDEKVE